MPGREARTRIDLVRALWMHGMYEEAQHVASVGIKIGAVEALATVSTFRAPLAVLE